MKGLLALLFKRKSDSSVPKSSPGHASYTAPIDALDMGNKVFHKEYQEAIDQGLKALDKSPNDPMIHINLMNAYFKGRDLSPEYFDKSTEHARLAMLNGHHTGFAEYRLAVNLEKKKCYHQSIQLYNLILDTPGFHFTPCGMGRGIDFADRRVKALEKLSKSNDSSSDILFSDAEITQIIDGIKAADEAEERAQKEFERRQKILLEKIMKMR